MIDWKRVAQPQEDGYDTQIALQGLESHPLPELQRLRLPPNKRPQIRIFDDQVAVTHVHKSCPYTGLANGRITHPNIQRAEAYVRLWQAMFEQCKALLQCLHPLETPRPYLEHSLFSSSGCRLSEFGVIYATVGHPIPLAEAIVHETAHLKLFALGVGVESASRLITNSPKKLYVSPVIKDRLRPMTAVFHAEYTFTHILYLDILMLKAERKRKNIEALLQLLPSTLFAVEEGFQEVQTHAKVDRYGQRFLDGFLRWAHSVIQEGKKILSRHQVKQGL